MNPLKTLKQIFAGRDTRLGITEGRRRYDLPLSKSAGTGFLILLIALMTFLAVMTLSASFALGDMARRWSSGLENRLTIEIPAEISNGDLRTPSDINYLSNKVAESLESDPNIKNFNIMDPAEIKGLISPWLGEGLILNDIPLPGLIAVEMRIGNEDNVRKLNEKIVKINKDIKLDTHESWLNDILRLTRSLKFSSALVTLIIALTAISAIAGAVRSRMAEHKADVELLHLMGASDIYITRQFQRHAFILALQGALTGTAIGGLVLLLIGFSTGGGEPGLIPDFHLKFMQIVALLLLPGAACLIASVAARFTVLRVLSQIP